MSEDDEHDPRTDDRWHELPSRPDPSAMFVAVLGRDDAFDDPGPAPPAAAPWVGASGFVADAMTTPRTIGRRRVRVALVLIAVPLGVSLVFGLVLWIAGMLGLD